MNIKHHSRILIFPEKRRMCDQKDRTTTCVLFMPKVIPVDFEHSEIEELKSALAKKHVSYVLITCTEPSKEGDMDVEMACEGDPALLSMLVDGAKERLNYS